MIPHQTKLQFLESLKDDWDGYGSKAISPAALLKVRQLLDTHPTTTPFIAPTHDGELMLDWSSDHRELEIETTPDGWSVSGYLKSRAGRDNQFVGEERKIEGLAPYMDWFSRTSVLGLGRGAVEIT